MKFYVKDIDSKSAIVSNDKGYLEINLTTGALGDIIALIGNKYNLHIHSVESLIKVDDDTYSITVSLYSHELPAGLMYSKTPTTIESSFISVDKLLSITKDRKAFIKYLHSIIDKYSVKDKEEFKPDLHYEDNYYVLATIRTREGNSLTGKGYMLGVGYIRLYLSNYKYPTDELTGRFIYDLIISHASIIRSLEDHIIVTE